VLVVDDDIDIRDALSQLLTEEGFEAQTAMNGLEALRIINSAAPPDLIVLDLTMPHVDGHQVLATMQEIGLLKRIPVIVVSAVAYRLSFEAAATFSKPIPYGDLFAIIRRHCP
jgi:CheY-like chemotaxis protein